jgi:hypothetical protein
MNRTEILKKANEIINNDRQLTHGKPEDSFKNIANLWSAYLDQVLTNTDVAMLMTLMKIARVKNNTKHEDNFIDICGYSAIAGELNAGERDGAE